VDTARLNDVLKVSEKVLDKVHPLLALKTVKLIELMASNELYFGAHMGLRTIAEQDALYAQGRTKPGKKVTNAKGGQSWHNFGLAIDLVEDGDPKPGVQWSWANLNNFLKIGTYAKEVGLEWGGWWKSMKDYPHVEMKGDLTLSSAQAICRVGGLPMVWQNITDFYNV
jgi:peptidoglycan L-alanyl-D-glutamate endopeptidase CwlK